MTSQLQRPTPLLELTGVRRVLITVVHRPLVRSLDYIRTGTPPCRRLTRFSGADVPLSHVLLSIVETT
jgi:hypothetical protein